MSVKVVDASARFCFVFNLDFREAVGDNFVGLLVDITERMVPSFLKDVVMSGDTNVKEKHTAHEGCAVEPPRLGLGPSSTVTPVLVPPFSNAPRGVNGSVFVTLAPVQPGTKCAEFRPHAAACAAP